MRNHPHEMSAKAVEGGGFYRKGCGSQLGSRNILEAIANDDAEAVAKLATNELKAETIMCCRTPEYAYCMRGLGILTLYGETLYGLKLEDGQTLLDIARSNKKQVAVAALLALEDLACELDGEE